MNDGLTKEYLGAYTLWQSDSCFKLGRDSIRLAQFAAVKKGAKVCDLGCGIGSLLLLLSQREENLQRHGLEINPIAADLARRNLQENNLRGEIHTADLREKDILPPDSFDLVISNPPYFQVGTGFSGGRERMEETCSVEELATVAGRLLKTGGRFALVFRPERLPALFAALNKNRLEPKRLQLLSYHREKEPYAVLVEAIKDGGQGLKILPTHYQIEKG